MCAYMNASGSIELGYVDGFSRVMSLSSKDSFFQPCLVYRLWYVVALYIAMVWRLLIIVQILMGRIS